MGIDNTEDLIDVRDVIERVEELEASEPNDDTVEDREEYAKLSALLGEMRGYGGDHQWRGDWYPVTLIRDSYFEEYAREFAYDIGALSLDAGWPHAHIDWERAARELQIDYTSVEYDGVTYWYR